MSLSTTEELYLFKGFDQKREKIISESVISALGDWLKDENPSVQEIAVSSLGKLAYLRLHLVYTR